MNRNDQIIVSKSAPFHKGRIGYFQFIAGTNKDIAVCSERKTEQNKREGAYFCVDKRYVEKV